MLLFKTLSVKTSDIIKNRISKILISIFLNSSYRFILLLISFKPTTFKFISTIIYQRSIQKFWNGNQHSQNNPYSYFSYIYYHRAIQVFSAIGIKISGDVYNPVHCISDCIVFSKCAPGASYSVLIHFCSWFPYFIGNQSHTGRVKRIKGIIFFMFCFISAESSLLYVNFLSSLLFAPPVKYQPDCFV
jgi:hypothetical protein